jgi:protein involved in polysaccharide export with SLBB domain
MNSLFSQPGKGRTNRMRPHLWPSTNLLILILLGAGLSSCSSTQSVERGNDGSTVYLDQLNDAAKAQERQELVQHLRQDVAVFHVGVGDEFKVFFDVNPKPTEGEYLISVGDRLRLEFLDDPAHSGTVTVRPDGRISLPEAGSMMAAGRTVDALARKIQQRYARVLSLGSFTQGSVGPVVSKPQVTVDVVKSHSPLDRFIAMIGEPPNNRSLTTRVLPDGTISLPLLRPVHAVGYPLEQLRHDIDDRYASLGLDVTVSLIPLLLRTGSTMVIGEVPRPGRISLDRPHTVLTAVAQAGGVLPTGSMESVRVVYVAGDDKPRVRQINLKEVINDLKVEDDMIVPDNSVIYVPPTELTTANRLAKTIAGILQIQGWGFSGAYVIDQPSGGTTPVQTR